MVSLRRRRIILGLVPGKDNPLPLHCENVTTYRKPPQKIKPTTEHDLPSYSNDGTMPSERMSSSRRGGGRHLHRGAGGRHRGQGGSDKVTVQLITRPASHYSGQKEKTRVEPSLPEVYRKTHEKDEKFVEPPSAEVCMSDAQCGTGTSRPSSSKAKGKAVAQPSQAQPPQTPYIPTPPSHTPSASSLVVSSSEMLSTNVATPRSASLAAMGLFQASVHVFDSPLPGAHTSDGRMWIWPHGVKDFVPSRETVTIISAIYKTKYEGAWPDFSHVPKEVRTLWWNEFKRKCIWDSQHEKRIHKIWRMKCSDSIRATFRDIRIGKTTGAWLGQNIRQQLEAIWASDEWKEVSDRNKKNRSMDDGGCYHRGGSGTILEHRRRLTKQLGRDVGAPEIFGHLQHNDISSWVHPQAKSTYTQFEELRQQIQASGSSVGNTSLWLDVVGGKDKRGRVYGKGSEASCIDSPIVTQTSASSPAELTQVLDQIAMLQRTVADQAHELTTTRLMMQEILAQLTLGRSASLASTAAGLAAAFTHSAAARAAGATASPATATSYPPAPPTSLAAAAQEGDDDEDEDLMDDEV